MIDITETGRDFNPEGYKILLPVLPKTRTVKTIFLKMKQTENKLDQFIRSITDEVFKVKPLEATLEQQENYTKPLKRDIEKPEWDPWIDNPIDDIFTEPK